MKAIMVALSISIASILGWFYVESTAGIPATIALLMQTNVYEVTTHIDKDKRRGNGTAVWLDSRHLLTNCHVADAFRKTVYKKNGEVDSITYPNVHVFSLDAKSRFAVEMLACDQENDVALLYSWWPNNEAANIRINWRTTRFGAPAYSAGYGMGAALTPKTGHFGQASERRGSARLSLNLGVAPGDSGSPIFDRRGDLRALVSATAAAGIGFAVIPIGEITLAVPGLTLENFFEEWKR